MCCSLDSDLRISIWDKSFSDATLIPAEISCGKRFDEFLELDSKDQVRRFEWFVSGIDNNDYRLRSTELSTARNLKAEKKLVN
jgi:hypothetical protein